jgi:ferredoxin
MKVSVNRKLCNGYASCILTAPTVFDLDNDDCVVLLNETPEEGVVEAVKRAARGCPRNAIILSMDVEGEG